MKQLTMVVVSLLLLVLVSVARGDPDYTITTNIHLSNIDGRPATINKNTTTTHVVNGCGALQKKVNKLSRELSETKIKAMKTRGVVKDLSKSVGDLEEAVASGDQANDRPNKCTLDNVDCGKCRCKEDDRLLSGYYCDCRHHPPMKVSTDLDGVGKEGRVII